MIKYSKWVLEKENIEIDEEIINLIVKHSQLDYRRLIIMLEYVFKSNQELTVENVSNLLEKYKKGCKYDLLSIIRKNFLLDFNSFRNITLL